MKKSRPKAQYQPTQPPDPVLAMLGVGKEVWNIESGDGLVGRLRSEDAPPPLKDQEL
jgi:hypothetical protein